MQILLLIILRPEEISLIAGFIFIKACETLLCAGTIDSNVLKIASCSELFLPPLGVFGTPFQFLSLMLHCEGVDIKGKHMFRYCLHLLD